MRLLLLVVVLCAVGCDSKKAGTPSPQPKGSAPADKPADGSAKPTNKPADGSGSAAKSAEADPFAGWAERNGDGFTVMAPQDPKVQQKQTTQTGKPLPTTMYTHYVPDGPGAMQVMFTDLDKKAKVDMKVMFDAMKESMLKQFNGKVVKQEDITTNKARGQEYWLTGEHPKMGKMGVHVKILLSERRLYLVQALWSADSADFQKSGDKFVESFKLQ